MVIECLVVTFASPMTTQQGRDKLCRKHQLTHDKEPHDIHDIERTIVLQGVTNHCGNGMRKTILEEAQKITLCKVTGEAEVEEKKEPGREGKG